MGNDCFRILGQQTLQKRDWQQCHDCCLTQYNIDELQCAITGQSLQRRDWRSPACDEQDCTDDDKNRYGNMPRIKCLALEDQCPVEQRTDRRN